MGDTDLPFRTAFGGNQVDGIPRQRTGVAGEGDGPAIGGPDGRRILGGVVGEAAEGFLPGGAAGIRSGEQAPERFALDALHDDGEQSFFAHELVHRHEIRVVERGGGLGFGEEAADGALVAEHAFGEELDGDVPVEFEIEGGVDVAHAAAADAFADAVVADPGAGAGDGFGGDVAGGAFEESPHLEDDAGIVGRCPQHGFAFVFGEVGHGVIEAPDEGPLVRR